MPNAPALVGAGVSALAKGRFATAEQLADVSAVFECIGDVLTVPESQLDAVTAVSGSGPAYFFLFVEALVDAAVANGLSRAVATDLAVQTMAGSAAMLLERLDSERAAGEDSRAGHVAGPAAGDGYLAGRDHRRWPAGTREGWGAGGRRRGHRRRENTL